MPVEKTAIAAATHINESAVIPAPTERVWEQIKPLTFKWLSTVKDVKVTNGASAEIGSLRTITYKDGTVQIVRLVELSDIYEFVSWEVVSSEPAASVSGALHTLRIRKVTADNTSFVEWTTDFSNDATQAVVQDSKFKKLEAFTDLASSVKAVKRAASPSKANAAKK